MVSACAGQLRRLAAFALCLILLSGLLTSLIAPWIDLPAWRVFRRCVSVSAALTLWAFLRFIHRQPLSSLGFGPWRAGKRHVAFGVLIGCGAILFMGGLYLASHAIRIQIHPDTWRVWRTTLGFVPAAGLVAVLEEAVFRGYLLQQLLICSTPVAVVGSSLAYALVHLRPNPVWPGSAFELVGLFLLGWVLALATLRTNQLYLAIGLHGSLAYWARVNKLLIEIPNSPYQWFVGTSRLVNGVGAWLLLLTLGILFWQGRTQARATQRREAS